MNASELRIGNYVYFTDFPIKNGVVKLDRGNLYLENWVAFFCDPIPLTEEWLLRCGFKKHINEKQIDGIEMTLQVDDNKTYFSSCGKLGGGLVVLCICAGNYFSNNLHYVHELQNLYFALTGKELEIKD